MTKKNNTKLTKLIKYYSLINYNLFFSKESVNRYKANKFNISSDKDLLLQKLSSSIKNIKNCELKKMLLIKSFLMGIPTQAL